MSVEALWAKPYNPNGGLPEDGEYFGIVGEPKVKYTQQSSKALYEVPITVNEGIATGEKVEVAIFFETEGGMNALKQLMFSVDERLIQIDDFESAIQSLSALLQGRTVRFKQKTTGQYVNYFILSVEETSTQQQQEAVITF